MTEREWREASDLRVSRLGLLGVLIAAAVLRFWALDRGIPYSVWVDEPEIVERSFNMMRSGSLNPNRFFDYPALYLYVQLVVSCVRFMWGALDGEWVALSQATSDGLYLWGRAVTAAIGVATVLLVFRIGLRWGGRHALLAAGLMAVMPLHVLYSHYVLTDTPLTFFVTLTLLLSLVAHEKNTRSAFVWAGVAAGLAAATKYSGAAAMLMPLIAAWMTLSARPSRLVCALSASAAAFVTFLVAAPYTVLDLPAFLNTFARLAGEYRRVQLPEAPAITYLKHLRVQFGTPAVLLAGAGLVLGLVRLVRGPGRVRWALTVIFPLIYFWIISRQQIVFARYLLPIVPMLCVLAAAAVVSGVSLLRRYEIPRAPRTALIAALTIAALLPPSLDAIYSDRDIARRGTVDMAYDWIKQNVPPGSRLALESRKLLLPPLIYKSETMPELRRKTYDNFLAEGVEYLVASSQIHGRYMNAPQAFPQEYADYMRIFEQSHELVRFSPSDRVPGPELRIYKVKP